MTRKYRKIATIEAEQFDGSDEMKVLYGIKEFANLATSNEWMLGLSTLEGVMGIKAGDWIATGIDGEHWVIQDEIFKRTYEEVQE